MSLLMFKATKSSGSVVAFTSYAAWKAVPEQSKERRGLMGSVLSPPELLGLPTTYAEMCLLCIHLYSSL